MIVVLVHHADALGADIDPERPLSAMGRTQADALARELAAMSIRPEAIWHSGKLRARQTAEFFWRACNPAAEFKMVRGLRPDDSTAWMRDMLYGEHRDVLIVSHMPLLPELARVLAPETLDFPVNGFVVLEREGERDYVERRRATADVRRGPWPAP